MGDYGLKVSEIGQNVITAPDDQLVYSSKFPGWKILAQGTFSISAPAKFTVYTTTISNLTSGGLALAWIENDASNGKRWAMPFVDGIRSDGQMRIKSTSLDLTIYVSTDGSTGTYNGYYYWLART